MNELTRAEADAIADVRQNKLEREFEAAKNEPYVPDLQTLGGNWRGYIAVWNHPRSATDRNQA